TRPSRASAIWHSAQPSTCASSARTASRSSSPSRYGSSSRAASLQSMKIALRRSRRERLLQQCATARQPRHDGADRHVEHVGDLAVRKILDLAKDQRLAELDRQRAQLALDRAASLVGL